KSVAELIDFLTAAGYLVAEGGQYPVLRVSDSGIAVLQGKQKVYRKVAVQATHVLPQNDDLFERLRAIRREFAKKQGVPPFVIFSDKTLRDMCAVMPQNEEEMLTVSGVGESKLAKYGAAFLKELKADNELKVD
ncbi:MAG TPA: DNA helicase RecQ, partial [Lactobacillus sp.]|nr:DNA helicase RecQ [Lactobacillus sp.]